MPDEIETTTPGTAPGTPAAVTPPAATPAAVTPPAATPPASTTSATTPPATPGAVTPGAADANANGGRVHQLREEEFKERLDRSNRSQLRDLFGTDDKDAILAKWKKADALEAAAEEQRRATLSNEQKLQEDLAKEKARADKAQAESRQLRQAHVVSKEKARVASMASKYIDPAMIKYAGLEFAAHLRKNFTPKQINRLTDKDVEKYFADLAKSQPKFAKPKPAGASPQRVGLTNGASNPGTPSPTPVNGGGSQQKTAKPGQPNSMTKAEIKKFTGHSW